MPQQLLIATKNMGKVREYRDLLADLPFDILSLADVGIDADVEETGETFAENAILKARTYARLSGLLTWADDSGLAVDALGGWPGVHSARHAGPDATDADRIAILLQRLRRAAGRSGCGFPLRGRHRHARWPGLDHRRDVRGCDHRPAGRLGRIWLRSRLFRARTGENFR
jgi:inosine/xanthosine triphosphate pyrophosphatase family protein